jgi:3-methyladenine DNA glycosylase AlkC
MAVGHAPDVSLHDRLDLIRPYADDPHFAVREWAWLSLRPHVAEDIASAIPLLSPWTASPSARVRRFASEVTRPRGVWSAHIRTVKQDPEIAISILEALKADEDRYVQDSVGNWLNDASKSNLAWVRMTCDRWLKGETSMATERICRRALRTSLRVNPVRPAI